MAGAFSGSSPLSGDLPRISYPAVGGAAEGGATAGVEEAAQDGAAGRDGRAAKLGVDGVVLVEPLPWRDAGAPKGGRRQRPKVLLMSSPCTYVLPAASGSSRSAMRRIVMSWKTPMPAQ